MPAPSHVKDRSRFHPSQLNQGWPAGTWFVVLGICYYLFSGFAAAFHDRHLYSDGAYFFTRILHDKAPTDFDIPRYFADLITQGPLCAAIGAGVRDATVLSFIYGASLFLAPFLLTGLCWRYTTDKRWFLFPAASLVAGSMNAQFFILTESHIMAAVFWPLLFLTLFHRFETIWKSAQGVLLAMIAFRSYESIAFLGVLLVFASLYPLYKKRVSLLDTLVRCVIVIFILLGMALAGYFILHPRDPANAGGFIKSLFFFRSWGRWHFAALYSGYGMVLILLLLFLKKPVPTYFTVLLSACLPLVAGAVQAVVDPGMLFPGAHYSARVVNLIFPFGLGSLFLLLYLMDRKPDSVNTGFAAILLGLMLVLQTNVSLAGTLQWSFLKSGIQQELSREKPLIPFSETRFYKPEKATDRFMLEWINKWTLPTMSILLSPGGKVHSLILPPEDVSFHPVDPAKPDTFPNLSDYGIVYTPKLLSAVTMTADNHQKP